MIDTYSSLHSISPEANLSNSSGSGVITNTVDVTDNSPLSNYFCFVIGQYSFSVSSDFFCELVSQPMIAPLPGAPLELMGLCNLRGNLVPVFQLHAALGIPLPPTLRVLVIGRGDQALGLVIDQLPIARQLDGNKVDAPQDPVLNALLAHLPHTFYALEQHRVCCLDAALLGPSLQTYTSNKTLASNKE